MSIHLGNSCVNCEHLTKDSRCKVHEVFVNDNYTCENFDLKASLKGKRDCTTCARYQGPTCANPSKASSGMLCTHWAPQAHA